MARLRWAWAIFEDEAARDNDLTGESRSPNHKLLFQLWKSQQPGKPALRAVWTIVYRRFAKKMSNLLWDMILNTVFCTKFQSQVCLALWCACSVGMYSTCSPSQSSHCSDWAQYSSCGFGVWINLGGKATLLHNNNNNTTTTAHEWDWSKSAEGTETGSWANSNAMRPVKFIDIKKQHLDTLSQEPPSSNHGERHKITHSSHTHTFIDKDTHTYTHKDAVRRGWQWTVCTAGTTEWG